MDSEKEWLQQTAERFSKDVVIRAAQDLPTNEGKGLIASV